MTRILVIIDPDETEHTALSRIREIPPTADVDYKVDLYVDARPVAASRADQNAVREFLTEKRTWLDGLVKPLKDVGYRITTEVIAYTRLYEDIIKSARQCKADFVFKPLRQHGALRRTFYTSTDWNLIRLCPMPLLLVNDQTSVHNKPIVAAVDVSDEDEAHKALNRIVLEQSKLLSRILEADVHVLFAYQPVSMNSASVVAGGTVAYNITRDQYEAEHKAAVALAKSFEIDEGQVHLREGAPDIAVSEYASEIDAGVTVLGTVARKGASGLFIGNTAEAVVERTATDVFVVKPGDFKAPV
ncbi:MAG: universal stress protein [Pseudomonadales bacterium]|nr:universal stress protein [Pseudomonadales bacterium]